MVGGSHPGSRYSDTEPNQNPVAEPHPHYHAPNIANGSDVWGHTDAPLSNLVGTAGGAGKARVSVESPPMGTNNIGIQRPTQRPDAPEQIQVSIVAINPTQKQITNTFVGDPRYSTSHMFSSSCGTA
jgi:hypothetical protein